MRLLGQFQTSFYSTIRFHKHKTSLRRFSSLTGRTKLDFVSIAVCTFPSLVEPV